MLKNHHMNKVPPVCVGALLRSAMHNSIQMQSTKPLAAIAWIQFISFVANFGQIASAIQSQPRALFHDPFWLPTR